MSIYIVLIFTEILFRTYVIAIDCGPPTFQVSTDQPCSDITVLSVPGTTVPGSILKFGCVSLLIRTRATIDYCPVQTCQPDGTWSKGTISCGGSSECYNSSQTYAGTRTCTTNGHQCQRWDAQSPHPHSFTGHELFPDTDISEAAGYCRDPGGVNGEPWCFTTDHSVERENCSIPRCDGTTISQGQCDNDYCGDPPPIVNSDSVCSPIVLQTGYTRTVNSTITYLCSSLLSDVTTSGIDYCPIRHCGPDFFWSEVSISCATSECFNNELPVLYQGRRTCTISGLQCQRWDSQSPHTHGYTDDNMFPYSSVSDAGAHCRDPGEVRGQPWCFTMSPDVEWEYCNIPLCSDLSIGNGLCSDTDPSTTTTPTTLPSTVPLSSTRSDTSITPLSTPSTSTVASGTQEVGLLPSDIYRKLSSDRTDMNLLETGHNSRNALDCCRQCGYLSSCVMAVYGKDGHCRLYSQNFDTLDVVSCNADRCYILNHLV